MPKWFDKAEVNTGRQPEFDYLKGFFMVLIYIVHAFQTTLSPEDTALKLIYIFNSVSGAAIFIFVMGFGTVYSKRASAAGFAGSGVKLIIYQYLNNLAFVAALLLPYPFVAASLTDSGKGVMNALIPIYLQYTNIFFISGIIYLIMALLKKLNAHVAVYLILGTAVSLAAPFLYNLPVDVPVLGYVVRLLIGEADYTSFTPLYFLTYALFGVAFAKLFRRVNNKRRFYLTALPVCAVIAVAWWVTFIMQTGTELSAVRKASGIGYINPDLWHVVASIAHILIMAAVIYFIIEKSAARKKAKGIERQNPVSKQLLYYSKHISKFYALHILTYIAALGFHGYLPFESWQCWVLTVICMIITEVLVRGYNKIYDTIKKRKAAKTDG